MIVLHRTPIYKNTLKKIKSNETRFDKIFSPNSVWDTNDGECMILKTISYKKIKIKFLNTGFIRYTTVTDLMRGNIKDYMKPCVQGIGYLGKSFKTIKEQNPDIFNKMYQVWTDMIKRCYDKNNSSYVRYGKIGVKVSEEWHNFSIFFYDAIQLPGWDKEKFINKLLFIDKDKLQLNKPNNSKIYSKVTCCWLTRAENNSLINSDNQKIEFIVTYPDGREEAFLGIREFARLHDIFFTNICACLHGKQRTYKGMKFRYK